MQFFAQHPFTLIFPLRQWRMSSQCAASQRWSEAGQGRWNIINNIHMRQHAYMCTYVHIYIYIYTYFSSSKGYQPKRQTVSKRWKQSRSAKSSKVAGTFTPYTCTHTHTQICILIGVHTHINIYIYTHTLQQFKRIQATAEGARWRNQTFTQVAASGCSWLSLGTSGRLLMLRS